MKRKMTDFALPGKCEGFAASGLTRSAAFAGGSSSEASASEPKPCAARTRTSRRVTAGRKCSRDIEKLIPVEKGQTKVRQRAAGLEKLIGKPRLFGPRLSREGQLPCCRDPACAIGTARMFQARGKGLRHLLHETGIDQRQRLEGMGGYRTHGARGNGIGLIECGHQGQAHAALIEQIDAAAVADIRVGADGPQTIALG